MTFSQQRAEVAAPRTVQEATAEEERAFVEAGKKVFEENRAEFEVLGTLVREKKRDGF